MLTMSLPYDHGWQLSKLSVPAVVARTWALQRIQSARGRVSSSVCGSQDQRRLDLLGQSDQVYVIPCLKTVLAHDIILKFGADEPA